MTTPPVDIKNTQMQVQVQQMQLQQNQIGSLAKGGKGNMTPEQKEKKLRESCEGFESIFIQKMWQQMRATVPKSTLLQGKDEQFWQGMYDQELSKKMASSGGIGLADMMYEQLSRDLVSASRTTASVAGARAEGGSGFMAQAAPLLPLTATTVAAKPGTDLAAANPKTGKPLTSDMYAGSAAQPEAPAESGAEAGPAQAAAGQAGAPGQTAQSGAAVAQAPADGNAEASSPSPVVQQFLAQLRQQQAQQGQQGQTTPEPQAVVTHSVQRGQSGVSLAQRAQLDAANKPPVNGVMPAQRNARLTPPSAPQTQAQAAQAQAQAQAQQGAPMQAAQAAAASAAAPVLGASPVLSEAQAFATQATAPAQAAAPAAEQPQVINTTFTTNIPPKNRRSSRPRGQRLPSGQPLIRTLNTAPASPITNNGQQVGRAVEEPARAVQGGQAVQQPPLPLTQPVAAAVPPRAAQAPDVVVPTVNAAMPLSSAAGSQPAPQG